MAKLTLTDIYGKDFVARYNRALSTARKAAARLRKSNTELYNILSAEDLILTPSSRSLGGYARNAPLSKLSPEQAFNNLKILKARSSGGLKRSINLLGDNILSAAKRSAFSEKLTPYIQRLSDIERTIFFARHPDLFEAIYIGNDDEINELTFELENFKL